MSAPPTYRRVGPAGRWLLLALLAGLVVATAVSACSAGRDAGLQANGWQDDLTGLRTAEEVALPVSLPPGLREISAVTGEGLPLVSFYSTNEPIVTVCTGSLRDCRAATRAERTLQTVSLDGATAVLTVERAESPQRRPLSDELVDFWSSVRLTRAAPGWLMRAGP